MLIPIEKRGKQRLTVVDRASPLQKGETDETEAVSGEEPSFRQEEIASVRCLPLVTPEHRNKKLKKQMNREKQEQQRRRKQSAAAQNSKFKHTESGGDEERTAFEPSQGELGGGRAVDYDARYKKGWAYGKEPSLFLAERALPYLPAPPGHVVSLGEGQGRNIVYLAGEGYTGLGVDSSSVGNSKVLFPSEFACIVSLNLMSRPSCSPSRRE